MNGVARLAPLVPLAVVLGFFADVWGTGRVFAAGDALVHMPLRAAVGRVLAEPSLFLWNPNLFAGYPTFADLNATPYYPFGTWWFFLLSPARAYVVATVTQYAIAALLSYAFLRRIRVGLGGAVFGAIAFSLGTPMIAQLQHIKIIGAAAWMPLAFVAVEDAIDRRFRAAAWKAAVATAFLWIGGDPQIAVYAGCAAAIYAALRSWQAGSVGGLAWLGLCAGLGTAIAAVQLLPMHELAAQSSRLGRPTVEFAVTGSLVPTRLVGFFVPFFFGGPKWGLRDWSADINFFEGSSYVGLVTLGLAAVAVVNRDRRAWPFVAVVVTSIVLALGRYNPLARAVAALPPFLFFRVPARWMIPCSLAVAALAGIGVDRLFAPARADAWRRSLRFAAAAFGVVLLVVLAANVFFFGFPQTVERLGERWVAATRLGQPEAHTVEWYREALRERWIPNLGTSIWALGPVMGLPLLLGAAALAALAFVPRLPARIGSVVLVALLIGDLWLANHGLELNATVERPALEEPPAVASFLHAAPLDGYRVYAWWGGGGTGPGETGDALARAFDRGDREAWIHAMKEMLPLDAAALWNVPLLNAHSPTWIAAQERAIDEIEGERPKRLAWEERWRRLRAAWPLLRLASIRYILSPVEIAAPDLTERFRTAALGGDFVVRVYELSRPTPRVHWVPRLRTVGDEAKLWQELVSPAFDPDAEALTLAEGESETAANVQATVTPIEERPASSAYRVHADQAGALVINQTAYPGWSATVNDRPQPIVTANAMFQAVRVPAGESVVKLEFRPRSLERGALVSLFGLAGVAIACAAAPRGRRG